MTIEATSEPGMPESWLPHFFPKKMMSKLKLLPLEIPRFNHLET